MVAKEQEPGRVPGPAEIDDHHAVLRRLHARLHVASHEHSLLVGQIADEDRVLDPLAVALHASGDTPQPTVLADVIGDQVTTAGHAATWSPAAHTAAARRSGTPPGSGPAARRRAGS